MKGYNVMTIPYFINEPSYSIPKLEDIINDL